MSPTRLAIFLLLALASTVRAQTASAPAAPVVTDTLKDITNAHARVVWMQNQKPGGVHEPVFTLMGFDTDDAKGERTILSTTANYFKPLLTADGQRVVFNDSTNSTVHIVNFDGSHLQDLVAGRCLQLWRDPKTKKDYAFIQRGPNTDRAFERNPMYKVPLDNPAAATLAWDKTPIMWDNFQVSRDGARVTMEAPWPRCIVATLPNGEWSVFGRGCYTATAPDDSYFISHLDGTHRNFLIFKPDGALHAKIPVTTIPLFKGRKMHQPRWSNHPLFFTMSGPEPDSSREGGSARDVEMWVGKFNKNLTAVETFARVTHNDKQEFYADLWVEGGEQAVLDFPQKPALAPATAAAPNTQWPGDLTAASALVFLWENDKAKNEIIDPLAGKPCNHRVEARRNAIFGPRRDMLAAGGYFVQTPATDNADLLKAIQEKKAFTFEATITAEQTTAQGGRTIAQFAPPVADERGAGNFLLGQNRDRLFCYVANRPALNSGRPTGDFDDIGAIEAGKPAHVLVTVDSAHIAAYVNGKRGALNADSPTQFNLWSAGPLLFGAQPDGKRNFDGSIEAVALYARAFDEKEARAHYAMAMARFKNDAPPEKLVVDATLVALTPTPDPNAIGTYIRALVEYQYKIDKVISGKDPGSDIVVRHWAVLDRKILPALADKKVGQSSRLTLEPYENGKLHAELDGERTASDINAPTLPVYYDPSR